MASSYAETMGTTNSSISFDLQEYSENNVMNVLLLYHLFGLLWTNEFLQAFGYTVIAGAVAEYYWTLDKATMSRAPIWRSVKRTMRYHLGTLAFGSLLIAIVQMIRLVLEYVDKKTKQAQESNKVAKAALYCCKCFLWCFGACVDITGLLLYIQCWYLPIFIDIFHIFRYFSDIFQIFYIHHIYIHKQDCYIFTNFIQSRYSEPIFTNIQILIFRYFSHIQIFLYSHIYSQTGLYLFTTFIQNWFSELIFRDIYQYSDIFISIYSSIFIIVYFSDIQISIYIHNIIHIQNFITSH